MIITFLALFSGFAALAATTLDDVIYLLRTGKTAEITRYVDDNIEISLPGKTDIYSRAQGTIVLKDFLSLNGIRHFEVQQKVVNGAISLCIGTLYTRSGNYRTTIVMHARSGKHYIREIRFQST